MPDPQLISVKEASRLAGVSVATGWRYVELGMQAGGWPSTRVGIPTKIHPNGKLVRVPQPWLMTWIEKRTEEQNPTFTAA
jgi:hypothetical protein